MNDRQTVNIYHLEVEHDRCGQRLDNYLFSHFKNVPKSHIYRIIRCGELRVNKRRAKASNKLSIGDSIRVPLRSFNPPPKKVLALSDAQRSALQQRILFEDERLVVLNKVVGEVMHAGSRHRYGLIDQINCLFDKKSEIRPVHRLDRGTTGCVVFAKTRVSALQMYQAFHAREVQKVYLALVAGHWNESHHCVKTPDHETGKYMETRFRMARQYDTHALLEARPVTGRTHQIRIHVSAMGCPIIGDEKYGQRKYGRQLFLGTVRQLFLHAWKIVFTIDGKRYQFEAPLPNEWTRIVGSPEQWLGAE